MSKPKGPFGAALKILDEAQGELYSIGEEEDRAVVIQAYRILEVAGKVDKQILNAMLYDFDGFVKSALLEDRKRLANFIRALLEALPEPEEERK